MNRTQKTTLIKIRINLAEITRENTIEHNPSWPPIPDHPYKMLIIDCSEKGKNKCFNRFNTPSAWRVLTTSATDEEIITHSYYCFKKY